MRHHEKTFSEDMWCVIIFCPKRTILLPRDRRHHMFWRIIIFSEECHSSKNAPIFCFDIHAPFTSLDAVFHRIHTIPFFAASGNRDRNTIRGDKRCMFTEWPPLPMMIDCCLEHDRCKHGRETIDRTINPHSIIRVFPNLVPWAFFVCEAVFVMLFFNLMIDPSEL